MVSLTRPVEQNLRLEEFKVLRRHWSRGIPWWDHLVFALLWWLEEKFLDARIKVEIDKAVKEFHEEMDKVNPTIPLPIYTVSQRADSETLSEGSIRLPEMRLTAPWYKVAEDGGTGLTDDSRGV